MKVIGTIIAIVLILGVVFCSGCIGGHDCPKCGTAMENAAPVDAPLENWWKCPKCGCIIDEQGGVHQQGVDDGTR